MSTRTQSPLSPSAILETLTVHVLRPSDFGSLVSLVAGSNLHYLSLAPGHLRRASQENAIDWTQGTVVARLGDEVVGFGLIERGSDSRTAQLTVGMETAYARGPVAERLEGEHRPGHFRPQLQLLQSMPPSSPVWPTAPNILGRDQGLACRGEI